MAPDRRGVGNSAAGTILAEAKSYSRPGSSLFLVRYVANDVGDVLVTFLLFLNEGGVIKSFVDLDILGALDHFAFGGNFLARRLGVRIRKRDELGICGLGNNGLFFHGRLGACRCGGLRPAA